jgi:hypothetical protein
MMLFVCAIDLDNGGISPARRLSYEAVPRSLGLACRWRTLPQAAVLTASDESAPATAVVQDSDWVIVGAARLDDRDAAERQLDVRLTGMPDLALILRLVMTGGIGRIDTLYGQFGFVIWHPPTRTLVAASDIFALKKLYYARHSGLWTFASRADVLAMPQGDGYDVRHLAERAAGCSPSPELTVYKGVHVLAPATVATLTSAGRTTRTYWSPHAFATDTNLLRSERDTVACGNIPDMAGHNATFRSKLSSGYGLAPHKSHYSTRPKFYINTSIKKHLSEGGGNTDRATSSDTGRACSSASGA